MCPHLLCFFNSTAGWRRAGQSRARRRSTGNTACHSVSSHWEVVSCSLLKWAIAELIALSWTCFGPQSIHHQGALCSARLKIIKMVLSRPLTRTRSVLWQHIRPSAHWDAGKSSAGFCDPQVWIHQRELRGRVGQHSSASVFACATHVRWNCAQLHVVLAVNLCLKQTALVLSNYSQNMLP